MSSSPNSFTGALSMPMNVSFTALVATLVLLLAVSSAIVVRSLILRRRHQRMVEEAIRTGTWMPDRLSSTSGRRRRDFGQKPKLWEAWLKPKDSTSTEENEKSSWGDIMPFHVAYINLPTPSPQGPTASSAEDPVEPVSRPARFMRPFARRRSPPSPQPTTVPDQALSSSSSSPTTAPRPAVRVAVLIAMPNPSHKHYGHSHESELPVVEIGVVEVSAEGDVIQETPSPDSS
ncbi:hypothetical protein JVT61DRAFT_14746 [Boletus reticuloceps]|uniref:Uncharacterized protein n=1 Tax=Boletus reticuloceps TaxID=495285 RepID=A0A8I2YUK1_9AGAM|nr:hypothetical protein JVT61DRAFT_14746 [Boletus reticuloceps]